MSNKLHRYVQINSVPLAKSQINYAKHIETEFIKSNKLLYASPVERLSKMNLISLEGFRKTNLYVFT